MTKTAYLFIACCLCFTVNLAAADANEPSLEHFARGYRLQTDGNSAIYRLSLPDDIYRTIVRTDLGDIRVFNSDGEAVPHAIRKPARTETRETVQLTLPIFPYHRDTGNVPANQNTHITIADDGRIIYIDSQGGVNPAEDDTENSYLIDLSSLRQTIDELVFELTGGDATYIKQVSLYHSENLNDWYPYVATATLARLNYTDHSLIKNRIKAPTIKARYLRFDWRGESNGLLIDSVRAILNTIQTSHERRWTQVNGIRSEDDAQIIEYDTGGLFPIDRIELILPEENTLVEATLSSRSDAKANWSQRYSGLFYKLQVQNNLLLTEPATVQLGTDRYWQLHIKTLDSIGTQMPGFKFGWVPDDLFFLARGTEPFTLAFGNGQIGAPGRPIDALMNVLSDNQTNMVVGDAVTAEVMELMGEEALAAELQIPWFRILLWTILIAGVIVTGYMAYRLIKQINLTG